MFHPKPTTLNHTLAQTDVVYPVYHATCAADLLRLVISRVTSDLPDSRTDLQVQNTDLERTWYCWYADFLVPGADQLVSGTDLQGPSVHSLD